MRCRQATRLISDAHERELALDELLGLRVHLLICPHCRQFQRNCHRLSQMMRTFKQLENQEK